MALRWLRREVELVLYPEEYHAYQGNGRPDRREDRHARMLAWFARYLPVTAGGADGAHAGDGTTVGSTRMGST